MDEKQQPSTDPEPTPAKPPPTDSPADEAGAAEPASSRPSLSPQPDAAKSDSTTSSEELIWVGRTNWKHFAGAILVWLAGSLLWAIIVGWVAAKVDWLTGGAAFWIAAVPIVLAGAKVGSKVIQGVYGQRYRLSDERLFIDRGLFSQTIDQTELIRVDDVRVRKSFSNRMLGLGSVEVLSTDLTDQTVLIEGITEAEEVAEAIRTRMRGLRKKSLFIENL